MKRKLLVIACVVSSLALMTAVIAAQEEQQEPTDGETDVGTVADGELGLVFLDEVGGWDGMAILHGNGNGETELSMGLRARGGFLGFGRGNPDNLGEVAVLRGTCNSPEAIAHEIGELQAVMLPGQQQDEEPEAFALVGSIPLGLEEMGTDAYILGVLAREDMNGAEQDGQALNGQDEEQIDLAVCGRIGEEPAEEPTPMDPLIPGTPTP